MSVLPVIIPRSDHSISRRWISSNAVKVLYRLKEAGHLAFLVGGGVRDLLLGREPKDFDIATDASPNEVKKIFRNCRLIGRRFRLAHIHFHDEIIEVATFRSSITDVEARSEAPMNDTLQQPAAQTPPVVSEGSVPSSSSAVQTSAAPERPRPPRMLKSEDGMILRDNVFGTPEEDAIRRDFTVNALFYSIADYSVIDYVNGMEDLKKGLIRIIGDPLVRFTEDPVRMVRAVRFAALLGFEIEEKTYTTMLALRDKIALASPARMYEEVQKLFLKGEGEKTFQMLRHTEMFGVLFPHFNAWLDQEEEGFPHTWAGKALEWVDANVSALKKVAPHMLFCLLFGHYIEEKWRRIQSAGVVPLEALDQAVAEFLSEIVPRVQLPRKAALLIHDILWNQGRFDKTQGKAPQYFLRRPGFQDAFEYLRFTSDVTGERRELVSWWQELVKVHPLQLVEAPRPQDRKPAAQRSVPARPGEAKRTEGHNRRRRRPRRRGPQPQAPKPQS